MQLLTGRTILFIVLAIFIIAVGHEVYVRHTTIMQSGSTSTSTPTAATSTTSIVTPDYHAPIDFSSENTPEIRTQLNATLASLQSKIAANQLDLQAWESLGAVYKIGGDYKHAEVMWMFLAETFPSSPAAFSDLGDLYMNFLKNYPKAEANYKKVISLRPTIVGTYRDLFTLYHYVYKDDTKAAGILSEGLKKIPGNNELLSLQEDLKAGR